MNSSTSFVLCCLLAFTSVCTSYHSPEDGYSGVHSNGQSNSFGGSGQGFSGQRFVGSDFSGSGSGFSGSGQAFVGSNGDQGAFGQTVGDGGVFLVTQLQTSDVFVSSTEVALNSVPVTITNVVKQTITRATQEVVRTEANDQVVVSTIVVTRPAITFVTDVVSNFVISTKVSTDVETITHHVQNILQTTVTSVSVKTLYFRPVIVSTHISHEYEFFTETVTVTKQPKRHFSYV